MKDDMVDRTTANSHHHRYLLHFALIVYVITTTGACLAMVHYLTWRAPWRSLPIQLILALFWFVALYAWRVAAVRPKGRDMLMAAACMFCITTGSLYYRAYLAHHRDEFPELEGRFLPAARNNALPNIATASRNKERLYRLLNDAPTDEQVLQAVPLLMRNEYRLSQYPPAQLAAELNWKEDPFGDRSWNWDLHNMNYVATLARAYEITGQIDYLAKAEYLVLSWISANNRYLLRPVSEFSWNEHSTAFRLMNCLYFYEVWKSSKLVTDGKAQTIFRSLLGHATLQSQKEFYFPNHNHGIDQDRSLMAFALAYPEVKESGAWLALSLDRIAKQFDFAVSSDGIHLEHSAGYHFYGMQQIERTRDLLLSWGVAPALSASLNAKLERMAQFVPNLVKPDGNLVQLGDTGTLPVTSFKRQLAPWAENMPLLRDLSDRGNTSLFTGSANVFKPEGYAVVRDFDGGTRDFPNSTYLFFTAAAHAGRGHRQADDLSFTLSANGHELLSDPGVYSYKMDAARDFVIGASAHNTVIVDGGSYKGTNTSLAAFQSESGHVFIKGSHRNFPGFEHVRRLVFVKPSLIFVVDDIVPVSGPGDKARHSFEQIYHVPPQLRLTIDGDKRCASASLSAKPVDVMRICQLGALAPALRIAIGEKTPMQGWHSPERAVMVPAPALIARMDGQRAKFVNVIELLEANGAGAFDKGFALDSVDGVVTIRWNGPATVDLWTLMIGQDSASLRQ